MSKINVLFLCTGNSARSQMAEAFLRHYAGEQYEAYSAGLEPAGIHPFTTKAMKERGIGMSGQRSKHVQEYMGKIHFGYLITVCSRADKNCPTVFPGVGMRLHWNLDDPAAVDGTDEEKMGKFRAVRDEIDGRIRTWLGEQGVIIES